MAWLQNLAGRAEDLLNKIDQNAATVLNDTHQRSSLKKHLFVNSMNEMQVDIGSSVLSRVSNESTDAPTEGIYDISSSSFVLNDTNEITVPDTVPNVSLSEYSEKMANLELLNNELNKQLVQYQHKCMDLRNQNDQLRLQLNHSDELVMESQRELEQYKARANRILKEKEQLLKNTQLCIMDDENTPPDLATIKAYNAELQVEMEFMQSKNVELEEKFKSSSGEIQRLQDELINAQAELRKFKSSMQQTMNDEKHMNVLLQKECKQLRKLLNESIAQVNESEAMVQHYVSEMGRLKQLIRYDGNQNSSDSSVTDMQCRLKHLTDILMARQEALELVTTERNALRMQLEQHEIREAVNRAASKPTTFIHINDTDDVKSQVPQCMRISLLDSRFKRRLKGLYGGLTTITSRAATLLRKYPLPRNILFCYLVALQLWAMLVFFWMTPVATSGISPHISDGK